MPTSKRKMNRKRWKQPKITGKRPNDRLGLTIHRLGFKSQKSPPHATLEGGLGWDNDKFLDGIYYAYRRY